MADGIILTGASGQLGRLLAPRLIDFGVPVYLGYHTAVPSWVPSANNVNWFRFSLSEPSASIKYLRCRDPILLHFACTVSNEQKNFFGLDCLGTSKLLDVMLERFERFCFVYASSIDANTCTNNYGVAKRFVENYLHEVRERCLDFQYLCVRLPVIQRKGGNNFNIAQQDFATTFLSAIGLEEAIRGASLPRANSIVSLDRGIHNAER